MKLDHDICYAAIKSRDARFDGRFFTAVLTTGIYCRPVCPAQTPRPENVRFLSTAAAAEEEGFRPCLRCRPEASPGTPEWLQEMALVSRALRLIDEGALDRAGVDELAQRLHIGSRQLRRSFAKQLGAPPVAVAQTRRLHFAKKLLDETDLPMTEIAFGAGYSSIRRFNTAIRKAYDRPPTELRRRSTSKPFKNGSHPIQLRLSYRPPFDWHSLIEFLRARAIPGVESITEDSYRRTVQFEEESGILEVRYAAGKQYLLLLIPHHLSRWLMQISERVRGLFDLKADPMAIADHLGQDEQMAALVQKFPGLRVPGAWNGFEIAVRAILGQQISVKAANTLAGRIARACGTPIPATHNDDLAYLFPRPEQLVDAELSAVGLMPKRAETIRVLARAVCDGRLDFGTAVGLEDALDNLSALPGVGRWTANYIAMRALREPDAFPAGDLVLRRAAAVGAESLSESQLKQRAEDWRPWRAYAAMYLWRHYATGSE